MQKTLQAKIADHSAKVVVVGLGYVGLPTLELITAAGFPAVGYDINDKQVEAATKRGLVASTSSVEAFDQLDIAIVCVPTPVDEERRPDYRAVQSATESLAPHLTAESLYILESTVAPGHTESIVVPILQKNCAETPLVAHCPERIDPGNEKWTVANIPRVVGGYTDRAGQASAAFYAEVLGRRLVRPMTTLQAAEAVKVVENTFRDINIAYVNELAMAFDQMGLDAKEIIDGASTKPFGFMAHYPGCGVGGHCIPVDPYYLMEQAEASGYSPKFLRLAREINEQMPAWCLHRIKQWADSKQLSLAGMRFAVLGVAYKPGVSDSRESPANRLIDLLRESGAVVSTFDPFAKADYTSVEHLGQDFDVAVLVTAHREFLEVNQADTFGGLKLVFDGRNALNPAAIMAAGPDYIGVGRVQRNA